MQIFLHISKKSSNFAGRIGARMKEDQHTEFKRLWKDEFFRELSVLTRPEAKVGPDKGGHWEIINDNE